MDFVIIVKYLINSKLILKLLINFISFKHERKEIVN